jgi:hypothetical protein
MKKKEVDKLCTGVYKVYWKSGGCSVAAVGRTHSGKCWIAPSNWTSKNTTGLAWTERKVWKKVKRVELILSALDVRP